MEMENCGVCYEWPTASTVGSILRGPLPALWGPHCMTSYQHCGICHACSPPAPWGPLCLVDGRKNCTVPWGPICMAPCQHCGVYIAWPAYSTMGSTVCMWPTASTVGSTLHGLPAVFKHLQKCSLFFYYVGGWKND